jgi:hypothetical protein
MVTQSLLFFVLIGIASGFTSDPNHEIFSGEMSSGEMSSGEMSSGEMSSGEMSSGEMSFGELSSGDLILRTTSCLKDTPSLTLNMQCDSSRWGKTEGNLLYFHPLGYQKTLIDIGVRGNDFKMKDLCKFLGAEFKSSICTHDDVRDGGYWKCTTDDGSDCTGAACTDLRRGNAHEDLHRSSHIMGSFNWIMFDNNAKTVTSNGMTYFTDCGLTDNPVI